MISRLHLSPAARYEIRARAEAQRKAALCAEICFDLTMLATRWPLKLYPGLVEEAADAHAHARELGGSPCAN